MFVQTHENQVQCITGLRSSKIEHVFRRIISQIIEACLATMFSNFAQCGAQQTPVANCSYLLIPGGCTDRLAFTCRHCAVFTHAVEIYLYSEILSNALRESLPPWQTVGCSSVYIFSFVSLYSVLMIKNPFTYYDWQIIMYSRLVVLEI